MRAQAAAERIDQALGGGVAGRLIKVVERQRGGVSGNFFVILSILGCPPSQPQVLSMARVPRKPDADSGTVASAATAGRTSRKATRCPACRSPRLLRHKSLFALSIAHVDCDAFYATIEKRDDPSLADKPVIVGGRQRGVVLTCCYVARTFGIRSAMPIFEARRLCPHATYVPPDMEKYAAVGRRGPRPDGRPHAAGGAGVDR